MTPGPHPPMNTTNQPTTLQSQLLFTKQLPPAPNQNCNRIFCCVCAEACAIHHASPKAVICCLQQILNYTLYRTYATRPQNMTSLMRNSTMPFISHFCDNVSCPSCSLGPTSVSNAVLLAPRSFHVQMRETQCLNQESMFAPA